MKKFAQYANLVLWIGLLIASIFSDQLGVFVVGNINIASPMKLGIYHIGTIILGVIGVILAIVPLSGGGSTEK